MEVHSMSKFRIPLVSLALLLTASVAGAQRWGGSPPSTERHGVAVEAKQAIGGSWNGTASQWGGSPARRETEHRARAGFGIPSYAYFPFAMAAPAAVPVTYLVDTVFVAPQTSPVALNIVAPSRPAPELTAMDVYRQQRFKKP
jgi:hypothetical protein